MTDQPVVLGTWSFAGDRIWGASERAVCEKVVRRAVERGVDLFDTAPNYGDGRSEEVLGAALGTNPELRVATKIKIHDLSEQQIRTAVDGSRRRLGRDRIDLLQIHWPAEQVDATRRALETFVTLQSEGIIAALGVCNFGHFDIDDFREYPIVSNQIPYSLLWRVVEGAAGIAARSQEAGWKTLAYTVVQQGLLSGRYASVEEFPVSRHRTRQFQPEYRDRLNATLTRLLAISDTTGRSLLELSIATAARQPNLDALILGARTSEQLDNALDAAALRIPDDTAAELLAATEEFRRAIGTNPDMYQSRVRH